MGKICTPDVRFQIHMWIATELLEEYPQTAMEAAIEAFKAAHDMGRKDLMARANDTLNAALAIDVDPVIVAVEVW